MVLPAVLKRRHSLRDINILPVIKRIRSGKPEALKEFARIDKDTKTESLSMEEINDHAITLTTEKVGEILMLAGRDENIDEARWALHCIILYANEYGQPKGQSLAATEAPGTSGSGIGAKASATASSNGSDDTSTNAKKRQRSNPDDTSLEDMIASLEKAKRSPVQDLKQKVRSLCLMERPSDALILITLDELAKTAKREGDDESEIIEELSRQALRLQTKIDVPSLVLSVMGGKAADVISKAISKCVKVEKAVEPKKEVSAPKPLFNLYQNPPQYSFPPQFPPQFPPHYNSYPLGGYNSGFRGRQRFRPRGSCLFCDSNTHSIKDCDEMKDAKKIKLKK